MKLGAHMSIAGRIGLALSRGAAVGCETVQIFTQNNNRWVGKRLEPDAVREFQALRRTTRIDPVFAHNCYLVNLASADAAIRRRSVEAMVQEVERCAELELPFVILHPGAHGGDGELTGIRRIVQGLRTIIRRTAGAGVGLVLENTAGQGTSLGHRLEQLRDILAGVDRPERMGVCLDTSHLFAAGYDLRDAESYAATMAAFERTVGFEFLQALHLNDSKRELGSRVDRHAHIGQGTLGIGAFRLFLNDPRLLTLPGVIETEKTDDGDADRMNLGVLRRLRRRGTRPRRG